jgi:hypothetical protein
MTPTKRIKVRMTVTVEVDIDDWSDVFGCDDTAAEVRADVRSYFADQIGQLAAVEDAGLTVRVA